MILQYRHTYLCNAVQKLAHCFSSFQFSLLHGLQLNEDCVNLGDDAANGVLHPVNSSGQNCELLIRNTIGCSASMRGLCAAIFIITVITTVSIIVADTTARSVSFSIQVFILFIQGSLMR